MVNTLNYILKKYSLDPSQRSPIDIVNIGREDLAKLFAELKFTTGAEIGVEAGIYSEILCRVNPKLTLYSIDPWKTYRGYREHVTQAKLDSLYRDCIKRLKSYNCQIVRKFSEEAYQDFPDESLDFVYIDGNHDFLHVTQDLTYWSPKVKKGGIVAGDDYIRPAGKYGYYNNVKDVIPAYAYAKRINPWFVLREANRPSSWMWVKA